MNSRFKNSLKAGFKAGAKTAIWILKMMIPVTFGVSILKWLGVIELLAKWLSPVLEHIGLSAEGALIFITSALTSLYSSIAMIATLGVDFRMVTILAVMGLICHNLIVETIIQRKAGANAFFIVTLRISAAIIAAIVLNNILPKDYSGVLIIERSITVATGFIPIIKEWAVSMLYLIPAMFILIVSLNIIQHLLREFRILDYLIIPFKPLMGLFGLSKNSSFLWIVMNSIGLAYGGSILISEYEQGKISHQESRRLNTHVAISHSILEDSLIFIAIGVGAFWILVPRIILAIIAVWGERLYDRINSEHITTVKIPIQTDDK